MIEFILQTGMIISLCGCFAAFGIMVFEEGKNLFEEYEE